ncbi:MAG: GTPase family protein [Gammaproteobacteria bacterium]
MRMPASWPWVIAASLLTLPWLALVGLGGFWLLQNHLLQSGLLAVAALNGAAWLLGQRLKSRQILPFDLPHVQADARWPPAAEEAWAKIAALAETLDPAAYPLQDSQRMLHLARRVIGEAAQHFRPKAVHPELDVPLRNLLFIAEQVCRDMRIMLDENVPFSHLLTLEDGLQIWKWKQKLESGHFAYRLGTMLLSPISSIPRELSRYLLGKATDYPAGLLERWLLQTFVKKTGYYAIALYSGQLTPPRITAPEPEPEIPPAAEKPLRILVAGQLKAGKSSLINALFGELRAPTDVLPMTAGLTPYALERDNTGEVLVFDSPGYGDGNSWYLQAPQDALGDFDLVLLVCSATQAGREADAQFLSRLRTWFDARPERRLPPVLTVVTHIDLLRPLREWHPPYDIATPQDNKSENIRAALQYAAETLHMDLQECLPVCLKTAAVYNIDAVWTAIADKLPESQRAQYLRCLPAEAKREKWALVRRQLVNAGRIAAEGLKKIST